MRQVATALCLTLVILVGSVGCDNGSNIGLDFEKGLTAYKSGDYTTALRIWEPLADQGFAPAQYSVGSMYENAKGVPKNDETAAKWYTLAAEQGEAEAHYKLGMIHFRAARFGGTTNKDELYSHMWMSIAGSSGDKVADQKRVLLEKLMKPSQLAKAQKLATECVHKKYKGC